MKQAIAIAAAVTNALAFAQEPTLKVSPEDNPPPTPPITDCTTDFRERGRPHETPVEPEAVADLRTALEIDLGDSTGGFDKLQAVEPLCFYLLPDERLLLRDGRGWQYYFRKVPRWEMVRVDVISRPD